MRQMINLGPDADAYIRSRLSEGEGLSEALSKHYPAGKNIALIPEEITHERAGQLTVGGLMSRRRGVSLLADHVCDQTDRFPNTRFLVQDVWLKARDWDGQTIHGIEVITYNGSLYYGLSSLSEKCRDAIDAITRIPNSATFVGFIIHGSGSSNLSLISEACDNIGLVREIIVGAYDQEGFIVRSGSS